MKRLACFCCTLALIFWNSAAAEVSIEEMIAESGLREGPVATRDLVRWQPPSKIVVRGSRSLTASLKARFPDVEFVSAGSVQAASEAVVDADAVIGYCNDEVVGAADRLVWVQVGSSGVERCLTTADIADGTVMLTNMQKMSSPVIGEHAIALALSLARGLPQQAKAMSSGEWNGRIGEELGMFSVDGKTVLIVGLGGIGKAAAKRASGLGMRVVATRNSSQRAATYSADERHFR